MSKSAMRIVVNIVGGNKNCQQKAVKEFIEKVMQEKQKNGTPQN